MALLCGYCGEEITRKKIRIVHINICQEPSTTYFCNRDCKLNWIFKIPNLNLEKEINGNWAKEEVKSILDMAVSENETEELEKYLDDNNLKIVRKA